MQLHCCMAEAVMPMAPKAISLIQTAVPVVVIAVNVIADTIAITVTQIFASFLQ